MFYRKLLWFLSAESLYEEDWVQLKPTTINMMLHSRWINTTYKTAAELHNFAFRFLTLA